MKAEKKYFLLRYFCLAGTILFGSGSIIITKRLDIIGFYYPLFQTSLMFFGEALCVATAFVFIRKKNREKDFVGRQEGLEGLGIEKGCFERLGKFGFCISALFDLMGSFLEYFSFNMLQASVIVTFKMMVIVFIWAYRVFVLKKTVYRHQWLGLSLLLMGFLIVGFEVTFNSNRSIKWDSTAGFGIVLMIIAQIFNSLNIISEEFLMDKISINPLEVVSIEGFSGLFLCVLLFIPFRYASSFEPGSTVEILKPFELMQKDTEICILVVAMVLVIGMLNFFLVKTIKISDSLSLCTIDSGRVILVWILAIAFNFETILPVEITGGLSLILGILVYNEVLIIPCCGFKKSAKLSMKESQTYRELKIKDRDWQNKLDSILSENK